MCVCIFSEHIFMPPTSKKLTGHIGFGLCVHPCVRPSVRSRTMHARVLKFHIWNPHGKIFDTFFFLSELSPFLELSPFEKIRTKYDACHILWAVHTRVLKFHIWIPHGKIVYARFFLVRVSPFLELCPFEKIQMKSDACHILRTVHARVLKFHIWIPHGKIADPCFFSCPSYLPF